MKKIAWVLALASGLSLRATSYHVDSRTGDDAHDGRSAPTAWQTLARVNATTFVPGDRIFLRAGSAWDGVALHPLGSGTAEAPIVIDREGDGPDPALHGLGKVPWVLGLDNQEGWEISHLELTNHSANGPQHQRAVEIRAKDFGWVRHIHLKNLAVHDVNAVSDYTNDGDTVAKSFGGIATVIEGRTRPTAWEDLLIEGCTIRDVGPMGTVMLSSWLAGHRDNDPQTWYPSRHVVIRGNTFERIARNGLLVRGAQAPLIERNFFRECGQLGSGNAMFVFHCDDALVQFNEACFTRYNPGDSDAAGFDSDYNCRRSVFQFNYSHDNDYGFILLCSQGGRARGFNDGTVVRFNISENDGGNLVRVSGTVTNATVYNNTFYARPGMKNPREPGAPPRLVYHKSWQGWSDGVHFSNNIFYNDCEDAVYEAGESRDTTYDSNVFFGRHPPSEPVDARKATGDPGFVGKPGFAGPGLTGAARTYALHAGSSAMGVGIALPDVPDHDFAGQPLVRRPGNHIDAGAVVGPGEQAAANSK